MKEIREKRNRCRRGGGSEGMFRTAAGMTRAAMLTAAAVVIGILCKNFLNFGDGLFRVTFENLPIVLAGIIGGPLAGAAVGAAADILSYWYSVQVLAISPLVTLGAATVGAVAGIFSRYVVRRNGKLKWILSDVFAHLLGSLTVKSIALYAYYGIAVLWRVPVYIGIMVAECILLCVVLRSPHLRRLLGLAESAEQP